jgi:hypothetical protein
MSYAKKVEGYESTVDWMAEFLKGEKFIPMGDPDKAVKVMVDLVEHPQPPVHLVLGSEAVGILKQADAARQAELEKWMPVSISTDHDNAVNFLETKEGKTLASLKGY